MSLNRVYEFKLLEANAGLLDYKETGQIEFRLYAGSKALYDSDLIWTYIAKAVVGTGTMRR